MLVLVRDSYAETAVLGRLFFGGTCICYTLENRSKAIPCGTYNIENSKSPKFNNGAWMITFAFVLLVLLLGAIFFDVGDWRR